MNHYFDIIFNKMVSFFGNRFYALLGGGVFLLTLFNQSTISHFIFFFLSLVYMTFFTLLLFYERILPLLFSLQNRPITFYFFKKRLQESLKKSQKIYYFHSSSSLDGSGKLVLEKIRKSSQTRG